MDIKEIQLWIDISVDIGDATDANIGRFALLRDRQAKEKDSENEALHAKLADGQAVIRDRGHDAACPAARCVHCRHEWAACREYDGRIPHAFRAGPCSDACGHDRTTGEKV